MGFIGFKINNMHLILLSEAFMKVSMRTKDCTGRTFALVKLKADSTSFEPKGILLMCGLFGHFSAMLLHLSHTHYMARKGHFYPTQLQ